MAGLALAAIGAVVVWLRSALRLRRAQIRIEQVTGPDADAARLARAAVIKESHIVLVYGVIALVAAVEALFEDNWVDLLLLVLLAPILLSFRYARTLLDQARVAENRAH